MNINSKIERETRAWLWKFLSPGIIITIIGYLLYLLAIEGFFIGWELYFMIGCYFSILVVLAEMGINTLHWIYYRIYINDGKLEIRDGFFSKTITIPLDRVFYISSVKLERKNYYESILITDKRIYHKRAKALEGQSYNGISKHLSEVEGMLRLYSEKRFYYYRVVHSRYIFYYYFYLIYRNCENCRFSDVSMSMVKRFVESK